MSTFLATPSLAMAQNLGLLNNPFTKSLDSLQDLYASFSLNLVTFRTGCTTQSNFLNKHKCDLQYRTQ